jgi:hypothetical protein
VILEQAPVGETVRDNRLGHCTLCHGQRSWDHVWEERGYATICTVDLLLTINIIIYYNHTSSLLPLPFNRL